MGLAIPQIPIVVAALVSIEVPWVTDGGPTEEDALDRIWGRFFKIVIRKRLTPGTGVISLWLIEGLSLRGFRPR